MLEENEEKAGAVYKMVDHLIFSYLSRREYKNAESGMCSDSLWLRRRDPDRPILVQGSLHEKTLEDIVELFYHYGRFDVPSEFMYMEQQLRQISNQFTESLINFSQSNKKKFAERHSRFMQNQRRRQENPPVLNQNPTVAVHADKINGHSVPDDFILPTSSRASLYTQPQPVFVQNSTDPYPVPSNDQTHLVEEGSSRRKSKPRHYAQNVVKIIETIGTNKLQARENKQIGEDNWDLGNDFEPLFEQFFPDMELCNQMVLDVLDVDQNKDFSLLDEINGAEERAVVEKSREVINHQLHDSIEQIVGSLEFDETDQQRDSNPVTEAPFLNSEPVIDQAMESEPVTVPESSVISAVEPVEAVAQSKSEISQESTVVSKGLLSRMEDLFGREDGELTQSPKKLTRPEVVRESSVNERQSIQSSSKTKPRNLLDRSRSPVRSVERPRTSSSLDLKRTLDKARPASPKISRIDEDRRRDRERREEKLREKQREKDRDRTKEREGIGREKKRDQDRSRSSKKESEERTIPSTGRRLSAASTSSSSSALEERSPRPVVRERSPRPKETRKISPKHRREKEEKKKTEDRESEARRIVSNQPKKVEEKKETAVVVTKEADSKIVSSRQVNDDVFHQMFPSVPRFQSQIKIPKMKITREGSAPETSKPTQWNRKESESVQKTPIPPTEPVIRASPVILPKPVPVEERENTPEKIPVLSKGITDPALKNRIPKCTMSDSRLACMLSNAQQRREALAEEEKTKVSTRTDETLAQAVREESLRKRVVDEESRETLSQVATNESVNKVPKRRKINLEEAQEVLERLHGS